MYSLTLTIIQKKKIYFKICASLLFSLVLIATSYAPMAMAISEEQRRIYQLNIHYYDVDLCSAVNEAQAAQSAGTKEFDLASVARKYDLQSAIVLEVDGGQVGEYRSKTPPSSPASTMKVVIADVLLRQNNIDLDKTLKITNDVLYSSGPRGERELQGDSATLRQALSRMLTKSSNIGANLIMKELGGVSGFTTKAHAAGYTDTTVKNYYNSNGGNNKSTIADQAEAMNHIQTTGGPGYSVAKDALGIGAKNDNQYNLDDYKNKWGGTSDIASNVGAFKINNGKYIIGSYFEIPGGAGYESDIAKRAMHDGTEAIINEIERTDGASGGKSAYILGDSITAGAADELKAEFSKKNVKTMINASEARSITGAGTTGDKSSGLEAIDKDRNKAGFKDASAVVIALGTNSNPDFEKSMNDLIDDVEKYNTNATIYWVNVFSKVAHKSSANRTIEKVASDRSVRIINVAEAGIPTLSGADNHVHPTSDGQQKFADVVATAVRFESGQQAPPPVDDSCCIADNGASTVLPGKNNGEKIWNYLVQELGFNNIQAAGIMGNIKQESGYSPTALNPESGAYGIVQWYAERRTALEKFAKEQGVDKSNLPMQLEFLKKELEGGYKSTVYDPIKAATSLSQATRIWLEIFERPCLPGSAKCDAEMNKRMPFAQSWLDGKGDGAADGSGSAPPSSGCSEESVEGTGVGSGEFAWPLPKSSPVTSCYGYARGRLHTGLDIGASVGTTVSASDGGIIEAAGNLDPSGFGNTIVIKHPNGKWTLYAHLSKINVKTGQKVDQGQAIAKSGGAAGSAGSGSSQGPHLHFNIQTAGGLGQGSVDPLKYLPKDGRGISGGDCPSSLN